MITVPASFDLGQREATVRAAALAGIDVVRVINEPTAAALAYGLNKSGLSTELVTVLVFDLGGGTFNVSLLEIQNGVVEVKATCGDNALGGDDWDNRIADHLMALFRDTHGHQPVARPDKLSNGSARLRNEPNRCLGHYIGRHQDPLPYPQYSRRSARLQAGLPKITGT